MRAPASLPGETRDFAPETAEAILAGRSGFPLGSFLHDALGIPVISWTYDAFRHLNPTFLAVGLVLLALGVVLLAVGAPGGVIRPQERKAADIGGVPE